MYLFKFTRFGRVIIECQQVYAEPSQAVAAEYNQQKEGRGEEKGQQLRLQETGPSHHYRV